MNRLDATTAVNLTDCEREPIHIPGRVQSHGLLFVLDSVGKITQVSENAEKLLGVPVASVLGQRLDRLLEQAGVGEVIRLLDSSSIVENPCFASTVTAQRNGSPFYAIVHSYNGNTIVELEPATSERAPSFYNLYTLLRSGIGRLKGAMGVMDLCQIAAEEIRRITSFDRVMLYRFDTDWNGSVIAEDKEESWHSYLHLHFPASDIPRQARELYRLSRLRLITDVHATPASLVPQNNPHTNAPPDLSYAILRGMSPIHIQYLKNMSVGASMSVAVMKQDQLWGLIACHHREPLQVPYEVRAACEQISEIVALQLSATEYAQGADYRISLKAIETRMLARMAAHDNFVDGLLDHPPDLLALAGAGGCAVELDGVLRLVGECPDTKAVARLLEWLSTEHASHEIYHTDDLANAFPEAIDYSSVAGGILALSLPRVHNSHLVWFRPEIVRTIHWAGNPHKPINPEPGNLSGLNPRTSFETWKELVHGRSLSWREQELEAVTELRDALVGIILRKAEELATVNAELQRSNSELEAFSYSVSHDLRAPFRHIFGFSDLLQKRASPTLDETSKRYIHTIMESARYAGVLVDSLLAFSQMARSAMTLREIDMNELVSEVQADLLGEIAGRKVQWNVGPLPVVEGDTMMIKLAVRNLLSNALKYSRNRELSVIEIGSRIEREHHLFWVKDNGVGFDMRFKDKLFGVFQRLHRAEDFEGTGIGLANVRRTIERHHGEVWADSVLQVGSTFYFTLPGMDQRINKSIDQENQ